MLDASLNRGFIGLANYSMQISIFFKLLIHLRPLFRKES
jgi:hypothetical protein